MNATTLKEKRIVIWHISDNRHGHDNQIMGLVQALQQLRPCDYFKINNQSLLNLLLSFFLRRFPASKDLPFPDLIIGAGHSTHASIICAQRSKQGKTIVLMKPSLPASWFDLCFVPAHDKPPELDNIIKTYGVLNKIIPTDQHHPNKGIMLIGGVSKHYSWDRDMLLSQINKITKVMEVDWLVTDSPRTPDETSLSLSMINKNNIKYVPHLETKDTWLQEQLAIAGHIWVTEDSMSMIYEALTSGGAVGLFEVPRRRDSRITRTGEDLSLEKMITTFNDWSHGKSLTPPPYILYESRRCAEILLQKLSL